MSQQQRRRRANGEASRQRILDAAAEIAGERGYEGTSINLVSERSGLPASSIYWHFEDKDALIAAVIDRSFTQWFEVFDRPLDAAGAGRSDELFRAALRRTGQALEQFPDFLRLGLMLILERRPAEPTARAKFVEVRRITAERISTFYGAFFADLGVDAVKSLVTLSLALADGFLIASEVEHVDLAQSFDLMADAVLGAAERLRG